MVRATSKPFQQDVKKMGKCVQTSGFVLLYTPPMTSASPCMFLQIRSHLRVASYFWQIPLYMSGFQIMTAGYYSKQVFKKTKNSHQHPGSETPPCSLAHMNPSTPSIHPSTRAEEEVEEEEGEEKQALPWLSSSISTGGVTGQPGPDETSRKTSFFFFFFAAWFCLPPWRTASRCRCADWQMGEVDSCADVSGGINGG